MAVFEASRNRSGNSSLLTIFDLTVLFRAFLKIVNNMVSI